MASSVQQRRLRQVPLLAVLLLAAVAFGLAGALIAGAPPPVAGGHPALAGAVSFNTGLIITFGILAVLTIVWIASRRRSGTNSSPGTTVLPFLAVVAVLLLFVLIAPLAGHGLTSSSGGGTVIPPANGTPPPNPGGPNGSLSFLPSWSPGWVPFLVVGVIGIVVAVLALPMLLAWRRAPTGAHPVEPEASRSSLEQALRALDTEPGADPRARIIALYGELLARVSSSIDRWETKTAREVEAACMSVWHLAPDPAHTLTALFEEARYSKHPMSEEAVDQARVALRHALDTLPLPQGAS